MSFEIVHGDITKMKVDAIVNAANTQLLAGGGVCGAIFRAAGYSELQAACDKVSPIKTGGAVSTPAFKLNAKIIIHTAGPIWHGGNQNETELLKDCYTNSLKIAVENDCKSIAFPLISSGIYGVPKDIAMTSAKIAIDDFLKTADLKVYLVLFGI
ncbi:MAG: macro domain-containing protein [Selenomonadaceae bacterium]|nr:macro domain-containing protein [Selenomonadaceae bacterium]